MGERQMDEMKKEPNNEADEGVPDINDILEIFGITNIDSENEIEIDDGLRSSSTTSSTTTTTTKRQQLGPPRLKLPQHQHQHQLQPQQQHQAHESFFLPVPPRIQ